MVIIRILAGITFGCGIIVLLAGNWMGIAGLGAGVSLWLDSGNDDE